MSLDFAQLTSDQLAPARRGRGDHFVQLYAEDPSLVESVATFAGLALTAGDAAIIVGTEPHRKAIADLLALGGLDLDALAAADRFFSLDAGHALASFSAEGRPDESRFTAVIGGLIQRASASGRKVRVFGEMVTLLWDAGDVAGAIELEEMWNRLADREYFDLFCAYPTRSFDAEDESLLAEVCLRHSHVIPPA